jgi:DNA transformation protein and related proteins
MAFTAEYREWVLEQLRLLGPVTARSMFGGVGLYHDGLFFGLIDDDVLYLKVDESNRGDFEAAGTGPFRPYGDQQAMQYYEVPAEVLEDPPELKAWAEKSLAVARRKRRR